MFVKLLVSASALSEMVQAAKALETKITAWYFMDTMIVLSMLCESFFAYSVELSR